MQEVIKFRLSVNQLKTEEFNEFINNLENKTIASIMLKGFLYMHEHSKTKNDNSIHYIKNINDTISNIIASRKISESPEPKPTNIPKHSLKINKLPSAIIQKCASYLNLNDYLDFSRCDGLIYVASNSPLSLEELNMIEDGYPDNLNQFRLLKKLCISAIDFIQKYDENTCQFRHIKSLTLDMNESIDHSAIETFINRKYIDLSNVEKLKCVSFGSLTDLYEFKSFCTFLHQFPNVQHLDTEHVYFTDINEHINEVESLLPKLTALIFTSNDRNAELFRNKMIETHSKQMIHLHYDEQDTDLNIHSINLIQLKELIVGSPNIDSLQQFITSNGKLKGIFIDLKNSNLNVENNKKIKSIIMSLYTKYREITQIKLTLNINQVEKILEWTEIGLCELQYANVSHVYNYLKIIYDVDVDLEDQTKLSMDQIGLYLHRMINALTMSSIKHFMIDFTLYGNINAETKLELMNKVRKKYLTFENIDVNDEDEKFHRIIVSNKECAINGYWETWMVSW